MRGMRMERRGPGLMIGATRIMSRGRVGWLWGF
jgi:hypothetical protein